MARVLTFNAGSAAWPDRVVGRTAAHLDGHGWRGRARVATKGEPA